MVELRLGTGTVRVANRKVLAGGVGYEGRLVNVASILRTITEGTDELPLVLDDTSTRGPRFRDLFATTAPEGRGVSVWIGLTDDPDIVANRIHLFEGKVERVPGFTRAEVSIDVLRTEVIDDRLMGRLITLTDFPLAPPESIGLVIPIVFGNVELSTGRVINTNAIGRLFFNHFASDAFIKLQDSTDFPSSGTVQIGDEQITYTAKNDAAGELTGVTRGANGTIASDHAKDSEVRELGLFVVKFADHAVDRLDTFKILDPNGNLGEPVPSPASVDYAEATATWNELPKIRSSGVESLFHRVHFNAPAVGNAATDAQYAGRENPGYGTFDYAKVSPGSPLVVNTNTVDLGTPGDIKRVWLAIVHDSAPPSEAAEAIDDGTGFQEQETWNIAQQRVFDQIFDNVPLPLGGFTNATRTSEAVRDDIKNNGTDPAVATVNQMTATRVGVPGGYDVQFAVGVAALVVADIATYEATKADHDAKVAAAQQAASAAVIGSIAAGSTITFPGKSPDAFQLVPQDLTPEAIARFDDRTNDRLYDVEVQIEPTPPEQKTFIAQTEIEFAGIWSNGPKVVNHELTGERENAESIFDTDDNTGDATFNIPGEVLAGDGPGFAARVKFLENQEEDASSGFKVKSARIRVLVDTVTLLGYLYAPMLAYLEDENGKINGTEVNCRHVNIAADGAEVPTGCILAPEEFVSGDIGGLLGSRMQNLKDLRMVLEPNRPAGPEEPINCLNTWVCHTCELEVTLEKEPPPDPVIEDRKGITNHFEVTDFVNGDWSFFSDPARGGSTTVVSAAGELRVLEVFWVIEYAPYFDVSSSVPDVFAYVTGKVPGGNPADIAESIVTSDAPQGMGLPSTAIARESYNPARSSFTADSVRADFTIGEQVNTLDLLASLAAQCDFRQTWDQGRHRIVRKPSVGGMVRVNGALTTSLADDLDPFATLKNSDVMRDSLGFSRTSLIDTRTRLSVKFKPLPHVPEAGGSLEVISDTAEAEFGRREEQLELGLIRDTATATLVATRDLLRRSAPRWLVEMILPLFALELKLGDIVELAHLDFAFAAGEVLDASVETLELDGGPFIAIRLRLVVWQK